QKQKRKRITQIFTASKTLVFQVLSGQRALVYLFCNLLPVNQLTNQPVNNPAVELLKIGQFE
ncbi:MAG: hypothetical protein DRP83_04300, partial [Planctomycetota bacterium]